MRRAASSVGRAARHRGDRVEVEVDAQPGPRVEGPHGPDRLAVGDQQVVGGRHGGGRVLHARGVDAGGVAEEGRAPRLVQGRPVGHPVRQRPVDRGRVVDEAVDHLAAGPAPGVLERLGEVPVVQGDPGLDAALQQAVGQPPVEVEALGVDGPAAAGLDPRPGHREPVGPQPEVGHEGRVLPVPVVVVGRHRARVPAGHPTRGGGEGVPDRAPPPPLGRRPLHLVRRGPGPPHEPVREPRATRHPRDPLDPRTNCESVVRALSRP